MDNEKVVIFGGLGIVFLAFCWLAFLILFCLGAYLRVFVVRYYDPFRLWLANERADDGD